MLCIPFSIPVCRWKRRLLGTSTPTPLRLQAAQPESRLKRFWQRLSTNRMAVISLVGLILLIL
ncbi:MAG: hypothetical protein K8J31_23210, partial [Anaerolineae bacterium]|nr:hypothetical protein [Anaerolineae bacterium]